MAALTTAEAAQWYVERGIAVYPARATKTPLVSGWNDKAAARDPERARHYFESEFPDAAIGLACGPSRLVVIDVDPRNGGEASFRKLTTEVGLETFEGAPIVSTPSGGSHIYFRATADLVRSGAHALGPGVDVVAKNSGVLAPPSMRSTGVYAWREPGGFPDTFDVPDLPTALLERIRAREVDRTTQTLGDRLPAELRAGERNAGLTSIAGRLRWRYDVTEFELCSALEGFNAARCKPPLPRNEVALIAKHVSSYPSDADPQIWLERWLPHLKSLNEAKVAVALSALAEFVAGKFTPAGQVVEDRSGLRPEKHYIARKRLEELGAIRVVNRGRAAPEIELLPYSE